MGQRSRYVLPEVVEPATSRCFLVEIPNDHAYIRAFMGAMYGLSRPYVWQNDNDHTALAVGARMQTTFDTISEVDCEAMSRVQFRQTDCGLEASFDSGVSWETIYDPVDCIDGRVNSIIDQLIQDGVIQTGTGQQPPEPPPGAGECKTFHVRLNARDRWICPSPVAAGDTISVTNARGGWWDGDVSNFWFCPDGKDYLLGACDGTGGTDPTDPLTTAKHMQIVGNFGTTWFDAQTSPYVVPDGQASVNFFFQANDAPLDDNQGEIEFDVDICAGSWSYTFDFTLANGAFYVKPGASGEYILGSGWNGTFNSSLSRENVTVWRDFGMAYITGVSFIYDKSAGSGVNNAASIFLLKGSTTVQSSNYATSNGTNITKSISFAATQADNVRLDVNSGASDATIVIKSCTFTGTGYNPFI